MAIDSLSSLSNLEPDDGPGEVACLECNTLIPDDDTGNPPYCNRCWQTLEDQGFFDPV